MTTARHNEPGLQSLITFFVKSPAIANLIFIMILVAGMVTWFSIRKEEMPDFETNWLRITAPYPGATASDIEKLVIFEIEKRLKGVSGIQSINSTAASNAGRITVEFQEGLLDKQVTIQAVKDAVLSADLPGRIQNDISFYQFKTAEKAIIDIGLVIPTQTLLTKQGRYDLQKQALALESQLLSSPLISGISRNGFSAREISIQFNPELISRLELPVSDIIRTIREANFRVPAGSLGNTAETKVSIVGDLDTTERLNEVVLRSNFGGNTIKLKDVAVVKETFVPKQNITKVNGNEAIILNVRKSFNADILKAKDEVLRIVDVFQNSRDQTTSKLIPMDDESYTVRNRLNLIVSNGAIGFVLIVICLFLFLDFKSGFWVAMGIPFCLAFTLSVCYFLDFTVNNMTLAAIIIVLGIVVDDAIIVAENIARTRSLSPNPEQASVLGTHQMVVPIVVSILTTCIAFIPFYFFEGRFASFVIYIPTIVVLMLAGSLFESLFILPSHLHQKSSRIKKAKVNSIGWFEKVEKSFAKVLRGILKFRLITILLVLTATVSTGYLFMNSFKFVLFPSGESKEFFIRATAESTETRIETAKLASVIEDTILKDSKYVIAVRTNVGQSRRGRKTSDRSMSFRIEILGRSDRDIESAELTEKWEAALKELPGFENIRFIRGRFGFSSGSPIEVMIQGNDNQRRTEAAEELKQILGDMSAIVNSEVSQPLIEESIEIQIDREKIKNLGISISSINETLSTYVDGTILYRLPGESDEVEVKLTTKPEFRESIDQILQLKVANQRNFLIPLKDLVDIAFVKKPTSIERTDYKRTTFVFADLKTDTEVQPLDIAETLESGLLAELQKKYPGLIFTFKGEIEESRNSSNSFLLAALVTLVLIYGILYCTFNSFLIPLIIILAIPFGITGVIIAFYIHQRTSYGFFAAVGIIGMCGVVVNDSIVLIDSLRKRIVKGDDILDQIAQISSTRLRAVLVTTITTVAGLLPTAYGLAGYDPMLSEMMLAMGWGLIFGTVITLVIIPTCFSFYTNIFFKRQQVAS
ncbi:MAG: efflux RND transporter permease subunit [Pseudobacteriovorax sp.]|nr:efflux RND transporter permease subunit [Pseudobacteriovorax sp.]